MHFLQANHYNYYSLGNTKLDIIEKILSNINFSPLVCSARYKS